MVTGSKAEPPFVRELRRALQHLYDPAILSHSPLLELLGAAGSTDPVSCLQERLTEGIEWLKPRAGVPPDASAWRVYQILSQRYVEQFPQSEVAEALALSERQLRRLHRLGLQALADHLWLRYQGTQPREPAPPPAPDGEPPSPTAPDRELEWLRQTTANEAVDARTALRSALRVVAPLLESSAVSVTVDLPEDLPLLAVCATPFRHALLNVLTAALRLARGGEIAIAAETRLGRVELLIEAGAQGRVAAGLAESKAENLEVASRLLALSGGALEPLTVGSAPLAVRLTLPAVGQVPVLVIDDNLDTLQLYERYLTGTRYRFTGLPDPGQAVALAQGTDFQIIVLDLMLPQVDGWELLARLREHPKTCRIPIIVCSILPQEELALALGAAALIRKPVSQADFLAALDRQLALTGSGSG